MTQRYTSNDVVDKAISDASTRGQEQKPGALSQRWSPAGGDLFAILPFNVSRGEPQ